MVPGVSIISRKSSVASVNLAEGSGALRKVLGSRERLDWLQIDLNVAEIIIVQD